MKPDLFCVIVIAIVVLVGAYAVYIQIRTIRKGIETEAVVVGVRKTWDCTGDADFLSYTYTVEYRNFEGRTVTAALGGLTDSNKNLSEGDRIVIKYLKEKQDYQILVKKVSGNE